MTSAWNPVLLFTRPYNFGFLSGEPPGFRLGSLNGIARRITTLLVLLVGLIESSRGWGKAGGFMYLLVL